MIKTKIYLSVAVVMFGLAACKDNKPVEAEYKFEPTIGTQSSSDSSAAKTESTTPVTNTQTPAQQQSAQNATQGAVKLNPAHGQPGHDCAVAVGAPLPNQPVNTQPAPIKPQTAPVTNQQPTAIVTPKQVANTSSTKGLNPAHGQPGHRCEIAVGAPLDSKPTVQPQQPAVTVPAKTATAPGMNPPHGEPGHKCEIAVGAPLPKDGKKDSAKG